ncbi:MAG: hypothetical protein ABI120_05940 [Gemmatimonadaceae bacterium]
MKKKPKMLFTLEALEAKHGDCLLLHFGAGGQHELLLIDGGPTGVYTKRLRPRLVELRDVLAKDGEALPLRAAMVSHIDDDHINGILQLTKELRGAKDGETNKEKVVRIQELFHNSFSDLVERVAPPAASATSADAGMLHLASTGGEFDAATAAGLSHPMQLVLASVPQGRTLRNDANFLSIPVNAGFDGQLICAPSGKKLQRDMGHGLTLTFLGPLAAQLDKLQDEWAKWVAKNPDGTGSAAAADFVDNSPYNLSSIVVLVEGGGKTMLLTGDARGDYVIEGLEAAGLKTPSTPYHVDILKMPHHGSWRNAERVMFEQIVADHYIFSANGRDDNPDEETVKQLYAARGPGKYTLHFTNATHYSTNAALPAVTYAKSKAPAGVKVAIADAKRSVPAIVVDLGTPLAV